MSTEPVPDTTEVPDDVIRAMHAAWMRTDEMAMLPRRTVLAADITEAAASLAVARAMGRGDVPIGAREADRLPLAAAALRDAARDLDRLARSPDVDGADVEPTPEAPRPLPFVRVSEVSPERVTWAWLNRWPRGKLTIIAGAPGLGMTALVLDFAARATRGETRPGDAGSYAPENVLILAAEDGISDTLRPRLEVAGADLSRVHAVKMLPSFPSDLDRLAATIRETGAGIVVLDPGLAFVDADVDSHKDSEARRVAVGLAEVAADRRAAAVFIRHLNKGAGGNALYRGGGSIAYTATARSVLLVAPDPTDPGRRVLAATKSNLCAAPETLVFRVVADGPDAPPRIQWEGTSTVTGGEALAAQNDQRREATGKKDRCVEVLRELLQNGPATAEVVAAAVRVAGIDTTDRPLDSRAVRAARKALGIESVKTGWREWSWRLPDPSGTPSTKAGNEVFFDGQ